MKIFYLFFIALLVLLMGCSDDATVIKNTTNENSISCLRLVVFPADKIVSNTLAKLYDFDENCSNELQVSQKSGIVCNSNQNADILPFIFTKMDTIKSPVLLAS